MCGAGEEEFLDTIFLYKEMSGVELKETGIIGCKIKQ